MVYATYFTYDGVFSGKYGLQIAEFTDLVPESVSENEAFSPTLSTLKAPSLPRFYHGGVGYDAPPVCEFTVVSERIIPASFRSEILSWLIGRNSFKPLIFHNDDLEDFVYYCVFTESSVIYVNGECHGFRLKASFDSPYARGKPTVAQFNGAHASLTIYNKSDIHDGYTYPVVQFTGPHLAIVNLTDHPIRCFEFNHLGSTETVTVDCENHIITSSIGGEKLSNFTSKNWLRLRPGLNKLRILSTETSGTITCPWYAMIGY